MSFSFIVTPQLPDDVKSDLFERLITQSDMLDYFSEPRLLYGKENKQPLLIIRFLKTKISKPIADPTYRKFHQDYSAFVVEQFDDTEYSCELFEAGVMVKVENDLTEVIYLDKDGNHILHSGKELDALKDLLAASQDKANTISSEINKGNELSNEGKYDEALKCFEKVLEMEPDDPTALSYKGITLAGLGKENESMECFDYLLKKYSGEPAILNNKAQSLSILGKLDDAIKLYDAIIKDNPDYEKAYYNKGLIFQELKKYDQAIELYDKAIEINPNYEKALIAKNLAQIQLKLIDHKTAPSKEGIIIECPSCKESTKLIELFYYDVDENNPVDAEALNHDSDISQPEMTRETYDSFNEIMGVDTTKFSPIIAKIESHNMKTNELCLNSNSIFKVFLYYVIDKETRTAGVTFKILQKIV